MQRSRPALLWSLAALAALLQSSLVFAQTDRTYSLLVHPVFTPTQADLVYRPLIDYLNANTSYRFELETARDFHRYWLDIRQGRQPDLVLEDAHMIALRIYRDGFIPLVRADEPTSFSLLTADMDLAELDEFVARSVSTMAAPSLGHLVLASWFPNPMQQPVVNSTAASWLDAVEMVFAGESEAAVAPLGLAREYVNMIEVATSIEFPHSTIAASPELSESVRAAVRRAMLELHEDPDAFDVLNELEVQQFVAAEPDEFVGLESWLNYVFSDF